jgi:hypothetical protein
MPSDDSGPNWIISCLTTSTHDNVADELLISARRVWPRVNACARRELGRRQDDPENATLAAEVWEEVLQSIARSLRRLRTSCAGIANMDSYLIGVFWHRFNRSRRLQKRREQTIQLVASIGELDALARNRCLRMSRDIESHILAREVFSLMDRWLRRVWTARQYGYSWKEIAGYMDMDEKKAKVKFKYKLSVLRISLRN